MDEKLFTVNEVAERLQLNAATVQRWIRDGRLPAINLGGSAGYRIRAEDIEHLLYQEYGRIESLARRASAAEGELAEALGFYARGLNGATQQKVLDWQAEMVALSQNNALRAESFKDVMWFYRPTRTPIAAVEQSVATQLRFNLEIQMWNQLLEFGPARSVVISVVPDSLSDQWRLGLAFSQETTSAVGSPLFAHPLWLVRKNQSDNRLYVEYIDQFGQAAQPSIAVEPYENGLATVSVTTYGGGRMDIKVNGTPGYDQALGIHYHRFARLFAWAEQRPYSLSVGVHIIPTS